MVWLNDGTGVFNDSYQSLGSAQSEAVALGDLDGDGDLDAFVVNGYGAQANKVWLNDGAGIFSDSGQNLGGSDSKAVALGDVDGDGDLDAFVGNWNSGNRVWLNNGTGVFSDSGQSLGGSADSWAVALGDVDGDDDLDAFVGNWDEANKVWLNDGTGIFSDSGQSLGSSHTYAVALGDLDGDGDLDAFVGNTDGQANEVWLNDGMGVFSDSGQTLGGTQTEAVALGDVDNDGDLDAFVGNWWGQANKVWLNDGMGVFNDSGQSLGSSDSYAVALGDVDGDGDLDAFVGNWNEANKVWLNQGASGFCDYFDSSSLNPGWTWVDPLGDSSYSLTANPGYLRLYTPDGGHDLYQSLDAPRMLQPISGDFVATIKVTMYPSYNYQGAGLLIWQDENNYIRLERTLVDGVDMWYRIEGLYDGIQIPYSNPTVYLRVRRLENNFTAWYSENGSDWIEVTTVDYSAANTLQVGLDLINEWQDNPIWADFDYFELDWCASKPPIATIHSIAPNPATQGQDTITFRGSGQDQDENGESIVAYQWRSSLDGTLSTQAEFIKPASELSAGTHTIYFKVQDDEDDWSDEVYTTLTVNPSGSSPPEASISFIWYPSYPNPAVQGQDTIYFNGSGHDTDEGGAYIAAYDWASSIDGQLSTQEDFTAQASELSVGTHTVTFKVQDDEGEWSQEVTRTLTVEAGQADVRTLILVNRQKLETLYSSSEATQVMNSLNALAAHDSVKGLVVQVENDGAVAAAYAAWDADLTSMTKANAVAAAIKALVDAQWTVHPDLEYLVITGDDRAVPFRRVLDQTRYPESNYGSVSYTSATGAALHDDMSLTDNYYADATPTVPGSPGWDGHDLYVPDLGTGRLVETSYEIIAQIDTFLADDEVTASSAIVTGYDFIKDGAQAMCNELSDDGLTTDCTLIGESWNAGQFRDTVLNTRHAIVSINGHANHYIVGAPSGSVSSSDVAGATADHTRAILYTVGCHSGLNVPPTNPYQPLDTAQALAQHQANYIANTGYGWGYVTSIGLSEQLMLNFTERLVYGQSATLGQALAAAKQEYYLNEGDFDYYDEKIMIESTLYGLPMYRYTTPTATATRLGTRGRGQGATAIKEEQVTVLGDGLTVNSLSYQFPALTAESTDDGLYYTFGGLAHVGDGEPIQPKYTADLSFPETKAHGVVFKGGVYTDATSFDPVVDQAITETTTLAEPAFSAPGWYPPLLHCLNRLERGDNLVTLLAQFNPQSQTERVYDRLSFDVYYHTTSSDWTPPSITSMSSGLEMGSVLITVGAEDDSGIETVVIAYTDGDGTWVSSDLTKSGNSWTGSFPASADTEFFVQVVDKAGNVAASDNNGLYFQPGDSLFAVYLPLVLRAP